MLLNLALLCSILVTSSCYNNGQLQHRPKGYYTIVAPGTIRSSSKYQVSISLTEFHESCWFNISIELSNLPDLKETVEVNPRSTKLIQLQVPTLFYGEAKLVVIAFRGIRKDHESRLRVIKRGYTAYLQTDKAKYKPGELMQFRVIVTDKYTRPITAKEDIAVQIHDSQTNLIKEFSNVVLVQGVFRGAFQISRYPALGTWSITVTIDGSEMEKIEFQVGRYVLPEFIVDIDMKREIVVDESELVMTVKAAYTYGKPVKGVLQIHLSTDLGPIYSNQFQIDGEVKLVLNLKTDLNFTRKVGEYRPIILCTLTVNAVVMESSTGLTAGIKTQAALRNNPYNIAVQSPKTFDPKKLVNLTVSVTDHQGNPVQDTQNTVKLTVEGIDLETKTEEPIRTVHDLTLNENGVGSVSLNLTNDGFAVYKLTAEYLEWLSFPEKLERNGDNSITLDVLTERHEVGKEIIIQLTSTNPVSDMFYEVVALGDVLKSERISVPGNETPYYLHINATRAMVPKIVLFVHYVHSGIFDSQLKEIYVNLALQNWIQITTDSEVKPGSMTSVNVTTTEGSYVGLMAIDRKLLLSPRCNEDLSTDFLRPTYRYNNLWKTNVMHRPAIEAMLLTYSNAHSNAGLPVDQIDGRAQRATLAGEIEKPFFEQPQVRRLFAESWLFRDLERAKVEGWYLNEIIPDTIGSWAIIGFSIHPSSGMAFTESATLLSGFQEFYISMDLPSLVREGEIIEVPIYLANYLDEDLLANVTIATDSEYLETLVTKTSSQLIPAQGKVSSVYHVKPLKPGEYNVTVTAITPKARDAIRKNLTVVAEGIPQSFSKTVLVYFPEETTQENDIVLGIPDNSLPGSEIVQLSVVGDIFGPLMRSLEKLVRVPYGNGEDNIRYFVSNLLFLKYLKALNRSNPSLKSKAKLYLDLGYQNLLEFKHLDGSFNFFNNTVGITGDVWLTAYVVWGLQQAKQFTPVEQLVVDRGLLYLKWMQQKNGSYSSGKGADEDVELTAFVLLSFLVDNVRKTNHTDVIGKSLSYLYESLNASAMSTYALILGKHEKSAELLTKFSSNASTNLLKLKIRTNPDDLSANLQAVVTDFISLLESQSKPDQTLLPVVTALLSTDKGDRGSTRTMIALEELIKTVSDLDFERKALSIHFSDGQGVSGQFHLNSSNPQVLPPVLVSGKARRIHLQTNGTGYAIVQTKYTYNILSDEQSLSNYHTNVTVNQSSPANVTLRACVAARSSDLGDTLTAMEINLQSGYAFKKAVVPKYQDEEKHLKFIDFTDHSGSVVLYMENVDRNGNCVLLKAVRTFNVVNAKPGSVIVYDVQKDDQRSIRFIEIKLSQTSGSGSKMEQLQEKFSDCYPEE